MDDMQRTENTAKEAMHQVPGPSTEMNRKNAGKLKSWERMSRKGRFILPQKRKPQKGDDDSASRTAEDQEEGPVQKPVLVNFAQESQVQFLQLMKDPSMERGGGTEEERLTEIPGVKREWIGMIVEECMQRFSGCGHFRLMQKGRPEEEVRGQSPVKRQFLPRWIILKIIQTIFSNSVIFTFHHEGSFTADSEKYLPVLITSYVTLTSIFLSMLIYVSCSSFQMLKNPHSLLYVITSAQLTLITSTGELILFGVTGYHETNLQVWTFFLASCLELCLLTELYFCYSELKRVWNRIGDVD